MSQAVDQFESSDEGQQLEEDDYYTGSDSMSIDGPECTGMLVKWKPGSIWDSYPYQQHGARKLPLDLKMMIGYVCALESVQYI